MEVEGGLGSKAQIDSLSTHKISSHTVKGSAKGSDLLSLFVST